MAPNQLSRMSTGTTKNWDLCRYCLRRAPFSSTHKFDSGTGWPSFYRSLEDGNIVERVDRSHLMKRVEVRSKQADSHLGHLFDDSPSPTGLRYCINSASLRFVPVSELEQQGLGSYLYLFESTPSINAEIAVLAGGCFWGMGRSDSEASWGAGYGGRLCGWEIKEPHL